MDGPAHHRTAEELAAKARQYLGQGDGQDSAAVWAAVAQVHATLAVAAALEAEPAPAADLSSGMFRAGELETLKQWKENDNEADSPDLRPVSKPVTDPVRELAGMPR